MKSISLYVMETQVLFTSDAVGKTVCLDFSTSGSRCGKSALGNFKMEVGTLFSTKW